MKIVNKKNIKIGNLGEDIASAYVKKRKYNIINRNYREKFGEIDIIAISPGGILTFFEVKTLIGEDFDFIRKLSPEDNFTKSKFLKLKLVCSLFAVKHQKNITLNAGWQIDLLAINIDKNNFFIRHYKNVCDL